MKYKGKSKYCCTDLLQHIAPAALLFKGVMLGCVLIFSLCSQSQALAASLEYSTPERRERITLRLAPGETLRSIERDAKTRLSLELASGSFGAFNIPAGSRFLEKGQGAGNSFKLYLKDAGFGFMVLRPQNSQTEPQTIYLDIFADPIGKRWGETPAPQIKSSPANNNAKPAKTSGAPATSAGSSVSVGSSKSGNNKTGSNAAGAGKGGSGSTGSSKKTLENSADTRKGMASGAANPAGSGGKTTATAPQNSPIAPPLLGGGSATSPTVKPSATGSGAGTKAGSNPALARDASQGASLRSSPGSEQSSAKIPVGIPAVESHVAGIDYQDKPVDATGTSGQTGAAISASSGNGSARKISEMPVPVELLNPSSGVVGAKPVGGTYPSGGVTQNPTASKPFGQNTVNSNSGNTVNSKTADTQPFAGSLAGSQTGSTPSGLQPVPVGAGVRTGAAEPIVPPNLKENTNIRRGASAVPDTTSQDSGKAADETDSRGDDGTGTGSEGGSGSPFSSWPPMRLPDNMEPPRVLPPLSSLTLSAPEIFDWIFGATPAFAASNKEVIEAPFMYRATFNYGNDEESWKEDRIRVRLRVPAGSVDTSDAISVDAAPTQPTAPQGSTSPQGGTQAQGTFPPQGAVSPATGSTPAQGTSTAPQGSVPVQGNFPPQGTSLPQGAGGQPQGGLTPPQGTTGTQPQGSGIAQGTSPQGSTPPQGGTQAQGTFPPQGAGSPTTGSSPAHGTSADPQGSVPVQGNFPPQGTSLPQGAGGQQQGGVTPPQGTTGTQLQGSGIAQGSTPPQGGTQAQGTFPPQGAGSPTAGSTPAHGTNADPQGSVPVQGNFPPQGTSLPQGAGGQPQGGLTPPQGTTGTQPQGSGIAQGTSPQGSTPPQGGTQAQGTFPPQGAVSPATGSTPAQGTSTAPQGSTPHDVVPPQGSGTAPEDEQPVVYVDELGNPVEPPLDPVVASKKLEKLMEDKSYQEAYDLATKLIIQHNLSIDQRENVLHRKADAFFYLNSEDPVTVYQQIMDFTTEAINFNTKSDRNASAYLRLGYLNLQANNPYQAAAYFSLLRKQFPNDDGIPLSYFYWGNYQYEQGNLVDAREQYGYMLRKFPDSKYAREAALGMIRTDYHLENFSEAYSILMYTDKRWPRFYLDYPAVLRMMGDVSYKVNDLDKARNAYWLYYNLSPNAKDADSVLARLGDIYSQQRYQRAAIQVYQEAVDRFPDQDGGIISLMRLAEEGINDDPTLNGMFKIFERPSNLAAPEAYRKILKDYPESPLVPLVQLKLAMWSLWQKDYTTALDLCSDIIAKDPNSPLAPRAREVALKTFATITAQADTNKSYGRVQEVWQKYPILQTQREHLNAESRLSLAVSQWGAGQMDVALDTLEPFFLGHKIPEYSELALILSLDILVAHERWADIEDLGHRVEMWELAPNTRMQMDYAMARAYENEDKPDQANPLWRRLYEARMLPPEQQAFAAYYLARSAEKSRDIEGAYYVGQDALNQLKELAALNPERADYEKIKSQLGSLVDISESSGMLQEALGFSTDYLQYVEKGSTDYLAVRYRMSRIYKTRGDVADWESTLKELATEYPNSVYGKTAASELRSYELNNNAAHFSSQQF